MHWKKDYDSIIKPWCKPHDGRLIVHCRDRSTSCFGKRDEGRPRIGQYFRFDSHEIYHSIPADPQSQDPRRLRTRPGLIDPGCAARLYPLSGPRPGHGFDRREINLSARVRIRRSVQKIYVRWIRPHISREIDRQRLKLVTWDMWGYRRLFGMRALSPGQKLRVIKRFLAIDWNVPHAHKPSEIAEVCRALAERPARPGECMVEAGCWQGGSSAKFSVVCQLLGYTLRVYDSFQGVEPMTEEEKQDSHDFSGEYAAPEELVRRHIEEYGEPRICSLHAGWFADTLAREPVPDPVRVAYIDCDVAKGTREALEGIVPALSDDGVVFSQDFHIGPVRQLLESSEPWTEFGRGLPEIKPVIRNLARIRFPAAIERSR